MTQEWHCFSCGASGNVGNFCSTCGASKHDYDQILDKQRSLTLEEKATNAATWEHISMVVQLTQIFKNSIPLVRKYEHSPYQSQQDIYYQKD